MCGREAVILPPCFSPSLVVHAVHPRDRSDEVVPHDGNNHLMLVPAVVCVTFVLFYLLLIPSLSFSLFVLLGLGAHYNEFAQQAFT
jgi:hypothetical protein